MTDDKPFSPGVIVARPRAGMGVGLVVPSLLAWSKPGASYSIAEPVVRPSGSERASTAPAAPWYRRFDKR